MLNSFDIDTKTYISYIQMHLEHCYDCFKTICKFYDKKHIDRYANEFMRVFNVDNDFLGGG